MSAPCSRDGSRRARRAGFTLPELLIVLVLFSVVVAVTARILRGQRRSLAGAVALTEMRSQLRQAVHLLATELRPLAPEAGDIHEWGATGLRARSFFGSSVVCRPDSDSTLVLPSPSGSDESPATWLVRPQAGDSLLIYDSGGRFAASDDRWRAYEIAAITTAGVTEQCEPSYADPGAPTVGPAIRIRVSNAARLPRSAGTGAPVRFFRTVRHALYRSSDGRWYLGASDCNAMRTPACATIQPVSGPYGTTDSRAGFAGITIEYHDRQGRLLLPGRDHASSIARVTLVVRGETAGLGGETGVRDSLFLTVAPRGTVAGGRTGSQ